MGRTTSAEIVEPISKEPPQNLKNDNILSSKVQNSAPRHDPFNLKVDAGTNFKIVEQVLDTQTSKTAAPRHKAKPVSDVTGTLHRIKSSTESRENDSDNFHANTKVVSRVEVVSADVAPSVDPGNIKSMPKLETFTIQRPASISTSDLNTPLQSTRSSLRSEKIVPIRKVRRI